MVYAKELKVEHEPPLLPPEIKSFIELEDSFLESLLNFDGWGIEDHQASVMDSEQQQQQKPNLQQIKTETENEAEEEDLIQEAIGKVCLTPPGGGAEVDDDVKQKTDHNHPEVVSESAVKIDEDANEEDGNGSEVDGDDDTSSTSSSSSYSSASSSSSCSDDDEDAKKIEMEEGEIREEEIMAAAWSDDDEDDADIVKTPIRSVNEVKNLPSVPPVTVTIQPHHQTLPIGVVLSIMGSQVVVEGVQDHKPLSEGSILWITESRTPLGVVDEIFGPVKNPYYVVRYNSETEIPCGIDQGSLISFVPEFAEYVLNNNNLYKKGYDASGENDEECSEELEFSDDEKEAEYKRMLKMSKRRSNEEKNGHMKKDNKSRNRGGKWKKDHQPSVNSQLNCSSSGPQAFSQAPHIAPSGVGPNGFPSIQPQNTGFPPNGFPSNAPPFMQQNFMQQPFGMLNLAPFFPQFNTTGQMFPPNFVQGNFGAFGSWPSGMPQNNFNQSQAGPPMLFQGLPQGVAMPNTLQMENNALVPAGNGENCQNPNQGNAFSGMPQNNLNQLQAGPPMMFQGLPQGAAMPNTLQMENNNGAPRPLAPAGNGEDFQNPNQGNKFSNRGGRKTFQRGGGRFRGGPRSR